jgi:hypothetical protein
LSEIDSGDPAEELRKLASALRKAKEEAADQARAREIERRQQMDVGRREWGLTLGMAAEVGRQLNMEVVLPDVRLYRPVVTRTGLLGRIQITETEEGRGWTIVDARTSVSLSDRGKSYALRRSNGNSFQVRGVMLMTEGQVAAFKSVGNSDSPVISVLLCDDPTPWRTEYDPWELGGRSFRVLNESSYPLPEWIRNLRLRGPDGSWPIGVQAIRLGLAMLLNRRESDSSDT